MDDPPGSICNEAAALFAAKGFEGTSLQDVATAVGVTKAALYHYFPTKEALFEAIVLSTLDDLRDQVETEIAAVSGHQEKLIAFMSAHAGYFERNRDRYSASFFGRGGGQANYTAEQLAARKAYVRLLEELLENAVRDGAMSVPDTPIVARGILGMLNWMARWYRPDGPLTAAEIAAVFGRTLLSGVAPK